MTDKTLGWMLRLVGLLAIIAVFWGIQLILPDFYTTMWQLLIDGDLEGLTAYISSFGYEAILISIFMIAFINAIGLPSIPFLTVNGVIFGLIPGIVISWIGEVLGIEISFRLTRKLLRKQAQKVIQRSNMLEKLDSYSCVKTIMAGRAIPYSPNVVVTALSSLSHISYKDHFVANLFGKIPAVIIEVWFGHDLLLIREHWGRLLVLTFVVIAVYAFLWWRRKHQ
ncbi:TVP38/TMEM64 family protein [Megasphaera vaginalis (ex Bordigoni et al. 2020)]|uniref:TVP38/TMEM64 family protein n=1 Tax=Megasphaera vaginalis (ex Bordigoni et al. 2020) TaxID=2045301 RepID=UPI000C799087|nr:VTT domain-containing protein [Megasphaera vaginalis (ex Bordigoni et al. 2020)]